MDKEDRQKRLEHLLHMIDGNSLQADIIRSALRLLSEPENMNIDELNVMNRWALLDLEQHHSGDERSRIAKYVLHTTDELLEYIDEDYLPPIGQLPLLRTNIGPGEFHGKKRNSAKTKKTCKVLHTLVKKSKNKRFCRKSYKK